ncbi:MAG TPA: prepilin-type N-terminal cleavage/methylation domain-containing protein [Desulfotomaculum sp.]|nr:prepilin-type N-terminal cleavage/methylation domain-containing protein [Desulfotomaculum sp.]
MKRIRRILRGEQGFTLVELMVVVIILGILAAVAVPQFMKRAETARVSSALSSLQSMKSVIDVWAAENGKYPKEDNSSDDGIAKVLQSAGINWTGDDKGIRDPWGNAFGYDIDSDSYTLSCGKDNSGKYYKATNSSNPVQTDDTPTQTVTSYAP